MPDKLDIGENSRGEKLKVSDAKLKLDTENAGWWLSCTENIFSGERSLDGFIPLDTLIASVPHAAPQQAKKEPELGNRLRWLDGLAENASRWTGRRAERKIAGASPGGTDGDEQKAKIVAKHTPRKMSIQWEPMKILVFLLLAYTAVMLLIHVSTGKLLKEWDGPAESWIKSQFPPQRVLRVEALYWSLSLAIWPLWPSPAWKAVVVVFAVIHLGVWMASELHLIHLDDGDAPPARTRKTHRLIIAFDLVEAGALVAIAWLAVSDVLHPGQHLMAQHAARLSFAHGWLYCSFV